MALKWLLVVIATTALFDRGYCLSCPCYEEFPELSADEWRAMYCPADVQCAPDRQLIWDICHCCLSSCTQVEGESCGGDWDMEGVCGEGLKCYTNDPHRYDAPIGECVKINANAATNVTESTTVRSTVASGAVTTMPVENVRCGKKKMALMGEEERKKCGEIRRMRIQVRRERNGKRNTRPRF